MVMAVAGLGGCVSGGPTRLTAAGAEAPVAQAGPRCGRWVVGLDAALADKRILVLAGGMGTAEAPRFVGDVVCQLGKRGPVLLAFGWPRDVASVVNMRISGSGSAESRLRDHALWTHESTAEAGLETAAMWELVTQLATWRAAGLEVKVATFGAELGPDAYYDEDSEKQYYQPAALREALRKHPDGTVVLWLGAEDGARQSKGHAGGTMGSRLEEMEFALAGYQLERVEAAAAASTTAPSPKVAADNPWASAAVKPTTTAATSAATVPITGSGPTAPWAIERRAGETGFDGVFRVGATTASAAFRTEGADGADAR